MKIVAEEYGLALVYVISAVGLIRILAGLIGAISGMVMSFSGHYF